MICLLIELFGWLLWVCSVLMVRSMMLIEMVEFVMLKVG